jgi:hypothetical protein
MVRYPNFEDWFDESEGYCLRSERFYDSLTQFNSEGGKLANIDVWLRAAFEAGQEALRPCRSPYCECSVGKCTCAGFYDARGD